MADEYPSEYRVPGNLGFDPTKPTVRYFDSDFNEIEDGGPCVSD